MSSFASRSWYRDRVESFFSFCSLSQSCRLKSDFPLFRCNFCADYDSILLELPTEELSEESESTSLLDVRA